MGITTAMFLLLKGYNVELISNIFPENTNIFNGRKEHMASQIAAGLIVPLFYDRGGNSDNFRMIKETWDLIVDLEKNSEYF